ncbi:MAG: hypothetical protein KKA37_01455 [Alphaproteobacteria bacterium]|jgi:hypothetical protein|nr:hypothetical protein [Alphaproteobacteria bacterium]MBU2398103.1 hypothetical protein [Alphaproteobacteria bacterium]
MVMTRGLHHIRLELPRETGNPGGAQNGGHDIVAPADAAGRPEPKAAWQMDKSCRVRRLADEETATTGWRQSSDRGGQDPDPPDDADDETRFRFREASCGLGEHLSLQAPDGATPTFRVGQLPAL